MFEIFSEDIQRGADEHRRLESELVRAIEAEQVVLHFQPIISLATGRIVAAEALIRWRHPELGLLGPGELLPACESTGAIVPLGRWILRRACRQATDWQQRFPRLGLRIGVNLSPKQLLSSEFIPDLDNIFKEGNAQPSGFAFEIHESVLVDTPEAMAVLWQLRKRGFRIHIDDFGTGYTALKELYRSPIDTLKVDRSFVARMKPGGEDAEIVKAAVGLASGLGLDVVAEGVEIASHLQQVRDLGLTHAQGFLFSRALPSDEASALIAQDPKW